MYNWMKKWRWLMTLAVTIIVYSVIVGASSTTYTGEVATVSDVNANTIIVKNLSGRVTTVSIPTVMSKLIQVNNEYYMEYEKRRWQKRPKLVSIEP
ncbi:hypothetical protein ACFO9Q_21685 [Paenibacillus sp. GCM10023252]|uniref:hypothetical protein n=1 Tax=Paenibacillus sp. GCM10023252 TaxID=3252649 RepID=UPI003608F553